MRNAAAQYHGQLVASALVGSWRAKQLVWEPEPGALETIASQLIRSGAGALVWRRVKDSHLRNTSIADVLQQQYRLNTVVAVLHRQKIEQVVERMRSAGIEAMLVKGWAAAGLYPDHGLRPYTDIDLSVHSRDLPVAQKLLKEASDYQYDVDLHDGVAKFGGGDFEEILARAQIAKLGEVDVRLPCAEDHLRILAIHMLREGAWRPLWLCDVAAAVESRAQSFNWEICLGQNRRWSNWVISALRLAHELLGADISGTPAAEKRKPLPAWLVPTVLQEWGTSSPSMALRHRAPMRRNFRSPSTLLSGVRDRWPNPIEGTVVAGGLFNEVPRLPFQLRAYLLRGVRFALHRPVERFI